MENQLELFVNGTNDTIGQINLYGDEPISLNISIQDVKDISKRNSTFSQTFTIPADKNNNILLNHIFNIGSDSTFDPRKKTPCFMLNDTVPVFTGQFQLTKINVKNKNVISYECVVYGEVIDLVKILGDKLLTNLDYSELNHNYNVDNIEASWTADTKTLGYYYPLIDYGYDLNVAELNNGILNIVLDAGTTTSALASTLTDSTKLWATNAFATKTLYITEGLGFGQSRTITSNTLTTLTISAPWTTIPDVSSKYNITQLDYTNPYSSTGNGLSPLFFKPAISNTYLFKKILSSAGFALDSSIIDSDIIGETIMPFNSDVKLAYDEAYTQQYEFRAALSTSIFSIPLAFAGVSSHEFILPCNDTTTIPNYDPANLYNQPGNAFKYEAPLPCALQFTANLRYSFSGTNMLSNKYIKVRFYRSSLASPYTTIEYDKGVPLLFVDYDDVFISAKLDNHLSPTLYPAQPGETFWATFEFRVSGLQGGPVLAAMKATDTYFTNNFLPTLVPGGYLIYNNFIPANIKQVDYIKSIITMFNLMVIPDKNNPKKLTFIPRNEYFNIGIIKDWTNKVDHNEKIEETLISEQQNKTIRLTYKEDKDFYNTDYKENTNTIFGEKIYNIDNEWVDGEKKIEVIFSPTPVDKVFGSYDIFIPKIAKRDLKTGVYGRTDFNIRFLRKNKTLMPTLNTIQLQGKSPINFYPYCGHLDHPTAPQMDYNFDAIKYSYYPELTSLTANNLTNLYWINYLDEISDKNAKIIKCKIYLTPNDIATFNYNDSIYIDGLTDDGGHYFYVNKITYAPTANLPSTVELIKTFKQVPLRRRSYTLDSPVTLGPIKRLEFGSGNFTESMSITQGNNNNIGTNSNGAVIIGDGNTITDNTKNVVLINTFNKTVDEPFTSIVGNSYFPQQGESYTLFNDIDSGLDMIINPFANTILNDIDSGLDAVRNIGGQSIISDIDSGVDGTKI